MKSRKGRLYACPSCGFGGIIDGTSIILYCPTCKVEMVKASNCNPMSAPVRAKK
jgi:predicted RNA-binding Zn-ribbon protein involved in translation (DUF1610 family)